MKSLPSTSVKCAFLPLWAKNGYAVGGTSGAGLKCPGMPHGMTPAARTKSSWERANE